MLVLILKIMNASFDSKNFYTLRNYRGHKTFCSEYTQGGPDARQFEHDGFDRNHFITLIVLLILSSIGQNSN